MTSIRLNEFQKNVCACFEELCCLIKREKIGLGPAVFAKMNMRFCALANDLHSFDLYNDLSCSGQTVTPSPLPG
jgi:hypothetical protein